MPVNSCLISILDQTQPPHPASSKGSYHRYLQRVRLSLCKFELVVLAIIRGEYSLTRRGCHRTPLLCGPDLYKDPRWQVNNPKWDALTSTVHSLLRCTATNPHKPKVLPTHRQTVPLRIQIFHLIECKIECETACSPTFLLLSLPLQVVLRQLQDVHKNWPYQTRTNLLNHSVLDNHAQDLEALISAIPLIQSHRHWIPRYSSTYPSNVTILMVSVNARVILFFRGNPR